ncbi:hypothetical protein CLPUN_38050 [Clostridium puniceum]|uniref:Uncharacterized protein n=1 Tax=Clostridium puniceum TaxID=29367 RepID=A0A1S8TAE0_9CLOT|nr:hypothetical protein [Clostridium puniceum]OOM74564.1 hypothetical protein CLPUN_38050 [Clostridium puniceum]
MKVCIMTSSKSMILIINEIKFNDDKTIAELISDDSIIGKLDLDQCELNKLDRTDGNMEYYELVEKEEKLNER